MGYWCHSSHHHQPSSHLLLLLILCSHFEILSTHAKPTSLLCTLHYILLLPFQVVLHAYMGNGWSQVVCHTVSASSWCYPFVPWHLRGLQHSTWLIPSLSEPQHFSWLQVLACWDLLPVSTQQALRLYLVPLLTFFIQLLSYVHTPALWFPIPSLYWGTLSFFRLCIF